jgi:transposase
MANIDFIVTLHQRGWSQRRIARELDIDRETVGRHLKAQAAAKPAIAPIGCEAIPAGSKPAIAPIGSARCEADSKPATADQAPIGSGTGAAGPASLVPQPSAEPTTSEKDQADNATAPGWSTGSSSLFAAAPAQEPAAGEPGAGFGRASACAPWRELILGKLDQGLSAQRIFQDLSAEHGYAGSYYSVCRFARRLGARTPLPFRRLECGPGQEVQVDFGTGAPIVVDGKRRRTHVFRVVLSHSRKAYSEVVHRQTTEAFVCCLENAFWSFGGVPERVVLDNLKAAVEKADWFDPELNPKVRSFAAHYGVVFLPTRPYTPRHKGKVERGVAYVQENALKGRTFSQLEEENAYLRTWEQSVADTRVHGTIRQQVGRLFTEVERPALRPLPAERFPFFQESRRQVHRDGHVEVAKAYYSVPPEYLGRSVWVRWDSRMVRVFNDRFEPIAAHVRQEPGRFSTHQEHITDAKIAGVERGAVWLLNRIHNLGSQATQWAEAVIANRGVAGVRVLQGLIALGSRHTASSIDRACGIALSYDAYRLRTIRALIDRDAPKQQPLPFVEEHPLIRSLADYGQLVHSSFTKENSDE